MNEKIEEYFSKRRAEEEAEKENLLIKAGLYKKEYMPEGGDPIAYTCYEYDQNSHRYRRFRKIPLNVTEEEFRQIEKYERQSDNRQTGISRSGISIALTIIAICVYIIGFFIGLYFAWIETENYFGYLENEFSWGVAISYWKDYFISGTMILAFSEVIQQLHKLNHKLEDFKNQFRKLT